MPVGDLYWVTPLGRSPDHPGPVIAYFCGPVPVVRLPGSSNTLVQPSSIGKRKKRPFMSGMLTTHGSLDTSSQTMVYSVSAFGAVTACSSTGGEGPYPRKRPTGPPAAPGSP